MDDIRIACIGGGHMGRALLQALLQAGAARSNLCVGEPQAAARAVLSRDLGIAAHADNAAAVAGAQLVILAVKPQDALATLTGLRNAWPANKPLLLSVAAGLPCADLATAAGGLAVVRAMPNRPALVGAGASGLFAPASVGRPERELAERVMRAAGTVVWVADEAQMDVVTAVSGSGPAYFFLLTEALAAAGVTQGLTADAARALAIATLRGAGELATHSDGDLARLRAEVTSKGGTTAAALEVLDAADGLRSLLQRAVAAATQRGRELGRAMQSAANKNS